MKLHGELRMAEIRELGAKPLRLFPEAILLGFDLRQELPDAEGRAGKRQFGAGKGGAGIEDAPRPGLDASEVLAVQLQRGLLVAERLLPAVLHGVVGEGLLKLCYRAASLREPGLDKLQHPLLQQAALVHAPLEQLRERALVAVDLADDAFPLAAADAVLAELRIVCRGRLAVHVVEKELVPALVPERRKHVAAILPALELVCAVAPFGDGKGADAVPALIMAAFADEVEHLEGVAVVVPASRLPRHHAREQIAGAVVELPFDEDKRGRAGNEEAGKGARLLSSAEVPEAPADKEAYEELRHDGLSARVLQLKERVPAVRAVGLVENAVLPAVVADIDESNRANRAHRMPPRQLRAPPLPDRPAAPALPAHARGSAPACPRHRGWRGSERSTS